MVYPHPMSDLRNGLEQADAATRENLLKIHSVRSPGIWGSFERTPLFPSSKAKALRRRNRRAFENHMFIVHDKIQSSVFHNCSNARILD